MKSYTISWLDMRAIVRIKNLKSARITGSFARGCAGDSSDLDIKLNEKDLQKFKQWLRAASLEFGSELPGHITYEGIELYTSFCRQRNIPDSVGINGLLFKTW